MKIVEHPDIAKETRTRRSFIDQGRLPRPRLRWILSFEAIFLVSLFPGFRGVEGNVISVVRSPAGILQIVSILVGLAILLRRGALSRRGLSLTCLGSLFFGYCIFSLIYSPSSIYGPQKALLIALLNVWSMAGAALVIAPSRERVLRLGYLFVGLSAIATLASLFAYFKSGASGSVELSAANYLLVSSMVGFGALLTLVYVVLVASRALTRVLASIGLVAMLLVMLVSGGRGPLLAALLASGVLLAARLPARDDRWAKRALPRVLALGLLAAAVTLPFLVKEDALTLTRLGVLLDQPGLGSSGQTRVDYYRDALSLWREAPLFGHGIGSWPTLSGFGDVRLYPHNMVLEVAAEEGSLGILLLLVIVALAIKSLGRWREVRGDPIRLGILVLLVYRFLEAQLSGDIVDNRAVFALLGLCAVSGSQALRRHGNRIDSQPRSWSKSGKGANDGSRLHG